MSSAPVIKAPSFLDTEVYDTPTAAPVVTTPALASIPAHVPARTLPVVAAPVPAATTALAKALRVCHLLWESM